MFEYVSALFHSIIASDLASGLVASSIIGAMAYALKNIPVKLFYFILDCMTLSITIVQENSVQSYKVFEHEFLNAKTFYLTGRFHLIDRYMQKKIQMGLGENASFLSKIGKKWAIVSKYTDDRVSFWHSYYYHVRFFTRNKEYINNFFIEADKNQRCLSDGDTIKVYQYIGGGWDYTDKRKIDLPVCLPNDKEFIRSKIAKFLTSEASYYEHDKPYREGFILSGDPGCGKSYFIHQIASAFDLNIYYVNLSSFVNDNDFIKAMMSCYLPSIILIEDIDCNNACLDRAKKETLKDSLVEISKKSKEKDEDTKNGVTLSTILNVFDGLLSQDGQIIFITTNHINKLDPALIRAGRFNTNIVFHKLHKTQIVDYVNNLYKQNGIFECGDAGISIAELSAMCDNATYEEAIIHIQKKTNEKGVE